MKNSNLLICLLLMWASVSAQASALSETWAQPLDLTIPSLEMPSTSVLDSKDKHVITMGWTCCYRNELINSVHQENLQKSIGLTLKEKKRKSLFTRHWRDPAPRPYWITFTVLQILDVHSTHQGLKYACVYEANPLIGKKPHLDRLILHKVVFLSPLYLSGYFGQISKEDLEWPIGFYTVVVANNYDIVSKAKRNCN